MNDEFKVFLTYFIVFCFLCLIWDSLKTDANNRKSAYLQKSHETQARQNYDFYRGVPVEVNMGEY